MNLFLRLCQIFLAAMLTENFVFVKFYGICPFLGVSKKTETAVGMGLAVTFTMTVASALTWLFYHFILQPFRISYLQTVAFILLIACLVQMIEMFLQKAVPSLYSALGIYLPLITTNCAVLGVALLNVQKEYSFIEATVNGFSAGFGFLMAIFLLSLIRERFAFARIPKPFRGFPIALIAGGLLALAFGGFQGMSF